MPAAGLGNVVVPFTMPMTPGSYVLKFFANNSSVSMATSAPNHIGDRLHTGLHGQRSHRRTREHRCATINQQSGAQRD